MSIETQVQALVGTVQDLEQFSSDESPEAIGDRLRELVAKLLANFEKIDTEEVAALIAQGTTMVTAFAAGRMIVGFIAFVEFMRMYRKAVASIPTAPA